MAHRDKSQGFGFVYMDIAKLLAQKNQEPVIDPDTPTINLNRDPFKSPSQGISEVKGNLDRLTALHHKLHVLMQELDALTKKKKS